jgi:NTP pyrophosphatase (non-canonical NTP hydrolase)
MGEFKHKGDNLAALAEECAEVIQVISKCYRFGGSIHDVPPGKDKSRYDMLKEEMEDLLYHWQVVQNLCEMELDQMKDDFDRENEPLTSY